MEVEGEDIFCEECRQAPQGDDKFCTSCVVPFPKRCGSCKALNPGFSRGCRECGTRLPPPYPKTGDPPVQATAPTVATMVSGLSPTPPTLVHAPALSAQALPSALVHAPAPTIELTQTPTLVNPTPAHTPQPVPGSLSTTLAPLATEENQGPSSFVPSSDLVNWCAEQLVLQNGVKLSLEQLRMEHPDVIHSLMARAMLEAQTIMFDRHSEAVAAVSQEEVAEEEPSISEDVALDEIFQRIGRVVCLCLCVSVSMCLSMSVCVCLCRLYLSVTVYVFCVVMYMSVYLYMFVYLDMSVPVCVCLCLSVPVCACLCISVFMSPDVLNRNARKVSLLCSSESTQWNS
jgi:hypothetical protein